MSTGEAEDREIQTGPEDTESGSLADDFREGPGIRITDYPAEDEPVLDKEEAEVPVKEEGKPSETPPEHKYKTHEEAEAGAREHQAAFTKKAEEAAREKEAREAAERELDELRKKLEAAEKPPEKSAEEPVETKPPTREEQKTRLLSVARTANKKALEKIGDLDRDDPDYREQVAAAWAEANTEALLEAGIGGGVSQDAINKMVSEQVKTTLHAEREAERVTREEQRKKDEAAEATRIEAKAKELGSKAGLNLDDPDSVDSIVWDRVKAVIPQEVYDKGTLEAQVEWVAAEVRRRIGKEVQTAAEREKAARKTQQENGVLGRGGHRPTKTSSQEEDLGSLGSDFAEIRTRRALRE